MCRCMLQSFLEQLDYFSYASLCIVSTNFDKACKLKKKRGVNEICKLKDL